MKISFKWLSHMIKSNVNEDKALFLKGVAPRLLELLDYHTIFYLFLHIIYLSSS